MSKLLQHLPALCNMVRRTAYEAGEITLEYFEEGMILSSNTKDDGSPVTEADRRAEDYIAKIFKEEFPGIPVVGEEAVSGGEIYDLSGTEYFWLVDPLDGTREFIGGSKDYTVNIALIQNNVPVLGVIYAPARGEMYSAHGEGTAIRWLEETGTEKPIKVRAPSRNGLIVVASKNRNQEEIDRYLAEQKVEKIVRRGSSLKICDVARGKADLYPGFGTTCEWDTAAGQAILTAAGGQIVDLDGTPLAYGGRNAQFHNPSFLARSNHLG